MTTEEWANRVRAYENNASRIIEACLKESANQFVGQLKNRVFKLGQDENNAKIGTYAPAYAKWRRERTPSLQTAIVDFQVKGDLLKSIKMYRDSGLSYTVKFDNPTQAKKGRWLERHFKGAEETIFDISKKERENALKAQQDRFDKEIKMWLGE